MPWKYVSEQIARLFDVVLGPGEIATNFLQIFFIQGVALWVLVRSKVQVMPNYFVDSFVSPSYVFVVENSLVDQVGDVDEHLWELHDELSDSLLARHSAPLNSVS